MDAVKDRVLRSIEAQATRELTRLASEFARAASAEKEELLAALEFERWLADSCREAACSTTERADPEW